MRNGNEKRMVGKEIVGKKGLIGFESSVQDLVWEQCMRMLMTNTVDQLSDLIQCAKKILNNLITNPGQEKYSSLPFHNNNLQKHFFCYNGGPEILQGVGFYWDLINEMDGRHTKVLRLPVAYCQNPSPYISNFCACLDWLDNTFK